LPWIGVWIDAWHALRRWFSGAEWSARLLRLEAAADDERDGLILVQIDGLSRERFERELGGRMKTMRRLSRREGYRLHDVYSGLPSTTPAAQGELFYGVRTAVPAFVFVDRDTGKGAKMLSPEVAERVEQRLSATDAGLLAEGSAYSNIYTGGAREPHFCAAALGWNGMFRASNPLSLLLALGWNAAGMARMVGRLLWEVGAIVVDLVRGLFGRLNLKREWEFIRSRLGVGIVLEELMTMAACVDAARGLPVIQLNYLSYDERAHLRGPDSRFARHSLRRIDAAIGRIRRAAHRSPYRHYAVWIYSDHGQEATTPYDDLAGQMFATAVEQVFNFPVRPVEIGKEEAKLTRASYLRRRRAPRVQPTSDPVEQGSTIQVAAIGPVGHLHLPPELQGVDLAAACRSLATVHQVPVVLLASQTDSLRLWTAEGEGIWPRDAKRLLGDDHPFADEIPRDLEALCHHRDAGDIIVLGWRAGGQPISFVKELGAHAGLGPHETNAFVFAPPDGTRRLRQAGPLRLNDLRLAAQSFLQRRPHEPSTSEAETETFRIVSYNVHSCVGLDGRLSPARIGRVLAQCGADVVALQELDVNRRRSGSRDQTLEIARALGFEQVVFQPAISTADEHYGDAILSRLPLRVVHRGALPGSQLRPHLEPRGAVWVEVDFDGRPVQIINTHLGLLAPERMLQTAALIGPEWCEHPDCRDPVVLLGDFNCRPGSEAYQRITAAGFRDAQRLLARHRPLRTWFSPLPLARIDHVFLRGGWEVTKIEVPRTELTAVASDHLPLVVELRPATDARGGRGAPLGEVLETRH
jgi:endonuclease/exonuclease/phosphatase family metal-dependent hydrolase